MRRLVHAAKARDWPTSKTEGSPTLAFAERHRRRIRLTTDGGEAVLLDLPAAGALADGLALAEGGWLVVRAAPEGVLDIEADGPAQLVRIAWHLGNRHLPVEVLSADRLRIAYDHMIEAMVGALGARCRRRRAPFQPEVGAYAGAHHHA